jgi:hypothetical protein
MNLRLGIELADLVAAMGENFSAKLISELLQSKSVDIPPFSSENNNFARYHMMSGTKYGIKLYYLFVYDESGAFLGVLELNISTDLVFASFFVSRVKDGNLKIGIRPTELTKLEHDKIEFNWFEANLDKSQYLLSKSINFTYQDLMYGVDFRIFIS